MNDKERQSPSLNESAEDQVRLKSVDSLIEFVAARVPNPVLQEKTLDAIDGGFEELMKLFKEGGIITTSGKIFPKTISDEMASVLGREYYMDKLQTTTAKWLLWAGGVDIDILGIRRNSKIFHINSGFEENLLYKDLPQGRIVRHKNHYYSNYYYRDMDNLVHASSSFLISYCESKGARINDIVDPNRAVRTLMVDVARHWGMERK